VRRKAQLHFASTATITPLSQKREGFPREATLEFSQPFQRLVASRMNLRRVATAEYERNIRQIRANYHDRRSGVAPRRDCINDAIQPLKRLAKFRRRSATRLH
jgi:hypothetical protein